MRGRRGPVSQRTTYAIEQGTRVCERVEVAPADRAVTLRAMNRWSFFAVLVIVARGVGAFAIYTFGYRDTGSSGLGRAEKARVASIVGPKVRHDNGYYLDDIQRTSPGHYLVRLGNENHPSVRECYLLHLDLAKSRQVSKVQALCD